MQQQIKDRDDCHLEDIWTYAERQLALLHDEEISAFKDRERQERTQQTPQSHYSVSMITDASPRNHMQQELQELKMQIAALFQNRGLGRGRSQQPPTRRTTTPPIMDPEWKSGACIECCATDHIISNCLKRDELNINFGKIPEGNKTLYQQRKEILRKQQQAQKGAAPSTGTVGSIAAHVETLQMPSANDAAPCQHEHANLEQLKDPKPFGWAVLRRQPVHAIQGGKFNALVDPANDNSDCDINSTIPSLKDEITPTTTPQRTKMQRVVRLSKQARRQQHELELLGVNNPQRVAAVLDQIRKGELQVPLPKHGTTLGKMLSRVASGSSINAASQNKHFKGATLEEREQDIGFVSRQRVSY